MMQITFDYAQTRIALRRQSEQPVRDPNGAVVGVFTPATDDRGDGSSFTDAEIAAAKRAINEPGPRYTTKEVLEHLRAMLPENDIQDEKTKAVAANLLREIAAQIILASAQLDIVLQGQGAVRVCDPDGNSLGIIAPATDRSADDPIFR